VVASVTLLAVGATAFVTLGKNNAEQPPPVTPPATRPLTYADGATIHYGDQSVTAAGPVVEVDVTDYGVAFRTSDDRLWFTDGSTTEQLGTLGVPGPAYAKLDAVAKIGFDKGWLVSDSSGSQVAWLEFPQSASPEVVVYDSLTREVVLREELTVKAGTAPLLWSVDQDAAYWSDDPEFGHEESRPTGRSTWPRGLRPPSRSMTTSPSWPARVAPGPCGSATTRAASPSGTGTTTASSNSRSAAAPSSRRVPSRSS
jgi:hypothetical protein